MIIQMKVIEVGDQELFYYPYAFIAELSRLNLSKAEAEYLREYLYAAGL